MSNLLVPGQVYLALYIGEGDWFNKTIRFWHRSPYSHSELVIDHTGYSSSIRDGGIRAKPMAFPADKWELIPLPFAKAHIIINWFNQHAGIKYGYWDCLLTQFLNVPGDRPGMFCFEADGAALGFEEPNRLTGKRLKELCLLKNEKYAASLSESK